MVAPSAIEPVVPTCRDDEASSRRQRDWPPLWTIACTLVIVPTPTTPLEEPEDFQFSSYGFAGAIPAFSFQKGASQWNYG